MSSYVIRGIKIPASDDYETRLKLVDYFTNPIISASFCDKTPNNACICYFCELNIPSTKLSMTQKMLLTTDIDSFADKLSHDQMQYLQQMINEINIIEPLDDCRDPTKVDIKGFAYMGSFPDVLFSDVFTDLCNINQDISFRYNAYKFRVGQWTLIQGNTNLVADSPEYIQAVRRIFCYAFDVLLVRQRRMEQRSMIATFISRNLKQQHCIRAAADQEQKIMELREQQAQLGNIWSDPFKRSIATEDYQKWLQHDARLARQIVELQERVTHLHHEAEQLSRVGASTNTVSNNDESMSDVSPLNPSSSCSLDTDMDMDTTSMKTESEDVAASNTTPIRLYHQTYASCLERVFPTEKPCLVGTQILVKQVGNQAMNDYERLHPIKSYVNKSFAHPSMMSIETEIQSHKKRNVEFNETLVGTEEVYKPCVFANRELTTSVIYRLNEFACVLFLVDPLLVSNGGSYGMLLVAFTGTAEQCELIARKLVDTYCNFFQVHIVEKGQIHKLPFSTITDRRHIIENSQKSEEIKHLKEKR